MPNEEGVYRWGFLGAGKIAEDFATVITTRKAEKGWGKPFAVASSTREKAEKFASNFGIDASNTYTNYEDLVKNPDVDVIYCSRTHNFHYEDASMALRAGKHVLCEKPLTLNIQQTTSLVELAKKSGVFFMEAFWTRFSPTIVRALSIVASGELGEVTHIDCNFGFLAPTEPDHRLRDLKLGGGCLLDIGVYCIAITNIFMGKKGKNEGTVKPKEVVAIGSLCNTGADEHVNMMLRYPDSNTASLTCSFRAQFPIEAVVVGKKGILTIHKPMNCPTSITIKMGDEKEKTEERPLPDPNGKYNFPNGAGMVYEAEHVMKCLEEGRSESPLHTWEDTLAISEIVEQVKKQIGLKYDVDK